MQKSYYAIIPANVRYDNDLPPNAKLLYGEITALCNEKGYCWAGNNYFAELYQKDKSTIARWIQQLEKKGYITREVVYKQGTREIENRYMRICNEGIGKNATTPIGKNAIDNNTDINTTFNNTKEYKKTSSRKQVFDEDSIHYQLASRLFQNILKNNPDHKKPNLHTWANDVRLMMERDKRTEEQITYLIDWVQNDSFWKTNILSVSKLRDKFDQLVLRVKEDIAKKNRSSEKHIPKAYQSLQDWADEIES